MCDGLGAPVDKKKIFIIFNYVCVNINAGVQEGQRHWITPGLEF